MARSSGPKNSEDDGADVAAEEEIWGTGEELLLACAVNRHGAHSWDSVADELRHRIPSAYAHRLTADLCRSRYRHLHRRFAADAPDHDRVDPTAQIPLLDQLRSLRVADLRQQLRRSAVSIGSLRLKVNRLKEERERSQKEPDSVAGSGSDPAEEKKDADPDPDPDRSCKESNSTDQKERIRQAEPDPAPGSGSGRAGETSYNGSSDTIAKGAERSPVADPNPVHESGESVAESKGGEPDGTKESSDVQSSASLSRRRRRGRLRKAAASDSGGADEPVDAESQPLIAVLETIRSSEYGPVFERRLESQDGARYESMIRRHVDFEIIQRRIRRKGFTAEELFRDLLLLCANAIVFFPNSSRESIAAVHLRDIVNKEISTVLRKSQASTPLSMKELTPPPAQQHASLPPKPAADPEPAPMPTSSLPPLVACRKRSSIATKPANKPDKDEKPKLETIEKEEQEEEVVDKKSTKQRSAVARGLRTNKSRSGGSKAASKSLGTAPKEEREPEPDPKPAASAAKKRSAANFLNRMKQSPPLSSSSGLLLEMLKSSSASTAAGKRGEKKKSQEDGRKEKEKEKETNAVKRSVGRPPKRTAAAPAKRRREETAAATPPPPSKKRARK